jgi:hypothetical protein
MILDHELLFSDEQGVAFSTQAENILDLGPGKVGPADLTLVVSATTPVGTGTISFQLSTSPDQLTWADLYTSGPVEFAVLGKEVLTLCVPGRTERYLKLNYIVSGTDNGATFTAGLVMDAPNHNI